MVTSLIPDHRSVGQQPSGADGGGNDGCMISCSVFSPKLFPLPSSRQYLSCDDCMEVRMENNKNCSVLC